MNELLTTKEAAEYLRRSAQGLRKLRWQGHGPRYLRPGRGLKSAVLYRRADLDAWLAKGEATSTADESARSCGR